MLIYYKNMYINDIYKDNIIKFKLDDNEIDLIDNVWEFSELFNFMTLTLHEYRQNIIKIITEKYTEKEFFVLELILEKLLWNLRWLIYPLIDTSIDVNSYIKQVQLDSIPDNKLDMETHNIESLDEIKHKMYDSNYYRSFVNKIINVDMKRNKIYYKHLEGSMKIFNKNNFNIKTMLIMRDRVLYEKIIQDPFYIINYKFQIPDLYYQYDYAFPNINLCCPFIGTIEGRKEKIHKMYYKENAEESWFKLLI